MLQRRYSESTRFTIQNIWWSIYRLDQPFLGDKIPSLQIVNYIYCGFIHCNQLVKTGQQYECRCTSMPSLKNNHHADPRRSLPKWCVKAGLRSSCQEGLVLLTLTGRDGTETGQPRQNKIQRISQTHCSQPLSPSGYPARAC